MNTHLSRLDDNGLGQRLRELAAGDGNAAAGLIPMFRTLQGAVAFDSGFDAVDAIRSAGVLEGRQLVVEADDVVVVLDLTARVNGYVISGQASGMVGPFAAQVLDVDGRELGLTTSDAYGEFEVEFEGEPTTLVLAGADSEIMVDLVLAAPDH